MRLLHSLVGIILLAVSGLSIHVPLAGKLAGRLRTENVQRGHAGGMFGVLQGSVRRLKGGGDEGMKDSVGYLLAVDVGTHT